MSADLDRKVAFTKLVPRLIDKAFSMGYTVTLGDAYRDPRLHGEYGVKAGYGASRSFHKLRQAIDLNLYKDGKYLEGTEAHKALGEWWESLDPMCTWGGRFNDGNHYSYGEGK